MLRRAATAAATAWVELVRPNPALSARISSSAAATASKDGTVTLAGPPARPTVVPDAGPALRDARAAHKAAMTGARSR